MMQHKLSSSDTEAELLAAFRVFDQDNSGTISADELRAMLKSLGDDMTEKEISDIIREADSDGDGNISFEEFKSIMGN
jgi:calmodulin